MEHCTLSMEQIAGCDLSHVSCRTSSGVVLIVLATKSCRVQSDSSLLLSITSYFRRALIAGHAIFVVVRDGFCNWEQRKVPGHRHHVPDPFFLVIEGPCGACN